MKQNIGTLNAFIRIMCGFTMLVCGCARMTKKSDSLSAMVVTVLGAMKIAEGITKFCPVTFIYENYQEEIEDMMEEV